MAGRLGDNAVVILPKAFYHEREFAEEVKKVEQKLQATGNAIRVRHELNYDSTGDPAVYFRSCDARLGPSRLANYYK